MLYHFGANAVALLHLAFVVFVLLGGLAVWRWPKLAWIHIPAAVWGTIIELMHWSCPLTSLENRFLRAAGQAGYSEGFIEHHVFALLYPQGLTRTMEIAIGIFVLTVNVLVYRKVFH